MEPFNFSTPMKTEATSISLSVAKAKLLETNFAVTIKDWNFDISSENILQIEFQYYTSDV